ncbi:MAG: ABC-2 transporter permease [Defluviitaleaceae bacterium]|nr:ABC-2 transporter permease [Defluviitaleaceae bacterium]
MIRKLLMLDWRAMKGMKKYILLSQTMIVFPFVFSSILIIPFCVFLSMTIATYPFGAEEKGGLNNLFLTMPIKRRDIVNSRFVLSGLLLVYGLIIGRLLFNLANFISETTESRNFFTSRWYFGVSGNIAFFAVNYLLFAIVNLFMYPVLFKLGYQKGKTPGLILPAALFGLLYMAFIIVFSAPRFAALPTRFISFASQNLLLVGGGIALFATAIMVLSYALSLRVFNRREF